MRKTLIVLFAVLAGARLLANTPANPAGPCSLYEHDVAADTITFPCLVTPEGAKVEPQVRLFNFGSETESVRVYFMIDDLTDSIVYWQATTVTVHPGRSRNVVFQAVWVARPAGSYYARSWHVLASDEDRSNDTCDVDFEVKPMPSRLLVDIHRPRDTVAQGDTVRPYVLGFNNAPDSLWYCMHFMVWDPSGARVYYQWSWETWQPPQTYLPFGYPPTTFSAIGWHTIRCSLAFEYGGLADSVVTDSFYVRRSGAIVESDPGRAVQRARATMHRGFLVLPGRQRAVLLDVTGRRRMSLQPGLSDVRGVAPGVYFLQSADGGERSAVRKVIIQR